MLPLPNGIPGMRRSCTGSKEENPDLDPVTLKKGDIVKVPVFLAVVHAEQPMVRHSRRNRKRRFEREEASEPCP